jgi:hypothetical protein
MKAQYSLSIVPPWTTMANLLLFFSTIKNFTSLELSLFVLFCFLSSATCE